MSDGDKATANANPNVARDTEYCGLSLTLLSFPKYNFVVRGCWVDDQAQSARVRSECASFVAEESNAPEFSSPKFINASNLRQRVRTFTSHGACCSYQPSVRLRVFLSR